MKRLLPALAIMFACVALGFSAMAQTKPPLSDTEAAARTIEVLEKIDLPVGKEIVLPSGQTTTMKQFRVIYYQPMGGWLATASLYLPTLADDFETWSAAKGARIRSDQQFVCDAYGEALIALYVDLSPADSQLKLLLQFDTLPGPPGAGESALSYSSTFLFDDAPCQSMYAPDDYSDNFALPQADGRTKILLSDGAAGYMRKQKIKVHSVPEADRTMLGYAMEFDPLDGPHTGREAAYAPRFCDFFLRQIEANGGASIFPGKFIWIKYSGAGHGDGPTARVSAFFVFRIDEGACRPSNARLD